MAPPVSGCKACDRMTKDSALLAGGKKAKEPITPINGKEDEAVLANVCTAPKRVLDGAAACYR